MQHHDDLALLVTRSGNGELVGQLQIWNCVLNRRYSESNGRFSGSNYNFLRIIEALTVLTVQLHHDITLRCFVDRHCQLEGFALVDIGLRSSQFQGGQLIVLDDDA